MTEETSRFRHHVAAGAAAAGPADAGPADAGPRADAGGVLRRCLARFVASTHGGGMLVACAFALLFIATGGSAMTNYAWREAQFEELEASTRAAIAALGADHLAGDMNDPTRKDAATSRLVKLLTALQPGFTTDPTQVDIFRDGVDIVIRTGGAFEVDDLWGGDDGDTVQVPGNEIRVRFESDRYEMAIATDMSITMSHNFVGGASKLDGLKAAMLPITDVMRTTGDGSVMAALVPFTSMVNVADTASGGSAHTAAKERYVRMLAGGTSGGTPLDLPDVLTNAKAAAAAGAGQWVDTFQRYGVGADMGALRSRGLPEDLLDDTDWNLRRTGLTVDISKQRPHDGDWIVNDVDFWNGCLMARWGAYWVESARPAGFDRTTYGEPGNWPVTRTAPGWSSGAPALPDLDLHISDVPPDAADPHTLFTAYSWPDAGIAETGRGYISGSYKNSADHLLQTAMMRMLDRGRESFHSSRIGFNRWGSIAGFHHGAWTLGGNAQCPSQPLMALTDDIPTVAAAIQNLEVHRQNIQAVDNTFMVRGMVWAVRALSPLWQDVWGVKDARGVARPGRSCAGGGGECDAKLHKGIVLVTDGGTVYRSYRNSRTFQRSDGNNWGNTFQTTDGFCRSGNRQPNYFAAWGETDPTKFNERFMTHVNSSSSICGQGSTPQQIRDNCRFEGNPDTLEIFDRWLTDPEKADTVEWARRRDVLTSFTPWELFRGPLPGGSEEVATDALVNAPFHLEGRPRETTGYCRPHSVFSPYGSLDDQILVGSVQEGSTTYIMPPVPDAAPFHVNPSRRAHWAKPKVLPYRSNLTNTMEQRLNGWLVDACRLAGQRGIRVHAVYIGRQGNHEDRANINVLRQCVQAAGTGGKAYVTPNADTLRKTFQELFVVRRSLRFVG